MKFKVTYILKNGDKKNAAIEAADEREAASAFENEGFVALVEKETGAAEPVYRTPAVVSFFRRPDDFSLMLFARELSTLLRAGLTMPESLDIIEGHLNNKMLKSAVINIKNDIIAGASFSAAVRKQPEVFSELFAKCVAGGEAASDLTGVLNILAQNLKNSYQMKSRLVNIMLYPAVILSITFCVFAFLLFYVVPSFESVFYEIKIDIPAHTAALFFISSFIKKNITALAISAAALIAVFLLSGAAGAARGLALKVLRKLPVSSTIVNNYSMFVFSGMLSSLLRSAAPALESFTTALFALKDTVADHKREAAVEILKSGGSFSKAVDSLGLADGVMARMCAVGERSGKISDMIDLINEYYLESLQNSIERLAEVLEPLIIFITGIFIAALILSVFLPIIKITMGGM